MTLKILWKYQKIKEVVCNLGTQSLFQFKIYGGTNMGLKEDASAKLQDAYTTALSQEEVQCDYQEFIDFVIDNTHLTYKYVLFTALLSKASDASINALCLQKKSTLSGAYDARTVCHKVIVPFEMDTLEKVLGGSNEPFLNKPARFPELSKTNAVRRGNDQNLLNSLCDNLPHITTAEDAYNCLVYLLRKLIVMKEAQESMTVFSVERSSNLPARLFAYMEKALEHSYEGEVLTLLVAGAYHLLYNKPNATVEVHPVNQSGASGREISDLDIYVDGNLVASNELKDKDYSETDVRHAADKVLNAGGTKMLFVEGPRSTANGKFISTLENEYLDRNFLLRVISYKNLLSSIVGAIENIDTHEFMHFILETAHETKFKEEVITYLDTLAQEEFGLEREDSDSDDSEEK